MAFKACIELLLDVETEGEACDAVAETMRPHLRKFEPESCIVDWRWSLRSSYPESVDLPAGFESDDRWPEVERRAIEEFESLRLKHSADLSPVATDPQARAAEHGCYIGHDMLGWYIADESEGERDDRGTSAGFDGRPHFAAAEEAADALDNAPDKAALLKAD